MEGTAEPIMVFSMLPHPRAVLVWCAMVASSACGGLVEGDRAGVPDGGPLLDSGSVSEGGTIQVDTGAQSDAIEDVITEKAPPPLCPQGEANCEAVKDCLKSLLEPAQSAPPESLPEGVFVFSREQDLFDYLQFVLQLDAWTAPLWGQPIVGANGHPYVFGWVPDLALFFVVDGYVAPAAYQLGVLYEQCLAQDAAAD